MKYWLVFIEHLLYIKNWFWKITWIISLNPHKNSKVNLITVTILQVWKVSYKEVK